MPAHTDFSEVVVNHFAMTQELHPDVYRLDVGTVQELIDAVPDENKGLVSLLKTLVKLEGVHDE